MSIWLRILPLFTKKYYYTDQKHACAFLLGVNAIIFLILCLYIFQPHPDTLGPPPSLCTLYLVRMAYMLMAIYLMVGLKVEFFKKLTPYLDPPYTQLYFAV